MTDRNGRSGNGFTLIEVLAVLLLTSLVLGLALDFYTDLTNASQRATNRTRELRQAIALVDRVARDLQGTVLVSKPPEEDPLYHPWLFLGESRDSELGADHLKFITRSHRSRSSDAHESDLAVVALMTREADDGTLELLRWISPRLPESLDRDFPLSDDPNLTLLADGIHQFGISFMGEGGRWVDSWDSSTLIESGELPMAARIQVSMASETARLDVDFADPDFDESSAVHSRLVVLPMRPIDLAVLLDPTLDPTRDPDDVPPCDPNDPECTNAPEGASDRLFTLGECFPGWQQRPEGPLKNYMGNHYGEIVDSRTLQALASIDLPSGGTALDEADPKCR